MIQIYDNGTVAFNNGSLSIVVLNITENDGAYFLYDSEESDPHSFANQKQYVMCLLENASIEEFDPRHLFIVTWKGNYFHNESEVSKLFNIT